MYSTRPGGRGGKAQWRRGEGIGARHTKSGTRVVPLQRRAWGAMRALKRTVGVGEEVA